VVHNGDTATGVSGTSAPHVATTPPVARVDAVKTFDELLTWDDKGKYLASLIEAAEHQDDMEAAEDVLRIADERKIDHQLAKVYAELHDPNTYLSMIFMWGGMATSDPGLAQFVQRLEASGIRVLNVNVNILGEGGQVLGEVDVVTQNALIQYKDGASSAFEVIEQVTVKTEPYVHRPVVTFVNSTGRAGNRTVTGAGRHVIVTNDFDALVELLKR
jgi:hypothetical protein